MLTEQFYKHWSGDKLDSIQCDTRFVDDINDDLQYFIDAETGDVHGLRLLYRRIAVLHRRLTESG